LNFSVFVTRIGLALTRLELYGRNGGFRTMSGLRVAASGGSPSGLGDSTGEKH
jgi:hypothetical protein